MSAGRRLTGCAASDHPDPAAAVGEVVGHLQNALAGSPQFALVLIDEKIGSLLSTVASVVHRLVGPDLLLTVAAPHVAGAEHLGAMRASVVVWALCGIDVAATDASAVPQSGAEAAAAAAALAVNEQPDGTVVVEFRTSPDAPRPMFITGDGRRWRRSPTRIEFPSGSATVLRGGGHRDVGPTMVATEAQGRTLGRLDHIPARAVLVDQLETTDGFIDGPSLEFPPLRAILGLPSAPAHHRRTVDVVDVDSEDGSMELAADVEVGDTVQLIAYDRDAAVRAVVERLPAPGTPGDHGVLLDGALGATDAHELDRLATAAVGAAPVGAAGMQPWAEVRAVLVHAIDED